MTIIQDQEQASGLLTVHEVAQRLRVDDTTVRRWIKSGALDAVALPHSGKRCGYRVRRRTLDAIKVTAATSKPIIKPNRQPSQCAAKGLISSMITLNMNIRREATR